MSHLSSIPSIHSTGVSNPVDSSRRRKQIVHQLSSERASGTTLLPIQTLLPLHRHPHIHHTSTSTSTQSRPLPFSPLALSVSISLSPSPFRLSLEFVSPCPTKASRFSSDSPPTPLGHFDAATIGINLVQPRPAKKEKPTLLLTRYLTLQIALPYRAGPSLSVHDLHPLPQFPSSKPRTPIIADSAHTASQRPILQPLHLDLPPRSLRPPSQFTDQTRQDSTDKHQGCNLASTLPPA